MLAATAAVAAGAYDLATVSTDYSAGGRPFVRIVSGPAGGTWYPLGAKMSQVFARDLPEVLSSSGPGGGIENVRDVNQRNAELGFSVSDAVYSGYRGLDKFRHPQSNVRHFATVYTNVFQIAVPRNSPIRSIADLKDKNRVTFGLRVKLENLDTGETVTYQLVGPDESEPDRGLISITSPIGKALIGKQVDDDVLHDGNRSTPNGYRGCRTNGYVTTRTIRNPKWGQRPSRPFDRMFR